MVRYIIADRAGNPLPNTIKYHSRSCALEATLQQTQVCWLIEQHKYPAGWKDAYDLGVYDPFMHSYHPIENKSVELS